MDLYLSCLAKQLKESEAQLSWAKQQCDALLEMVLYSSEQSGEISAWEEFDILSHRFFDPIKVRGTEKHFYYNRGKQFAVICSAYRRAVAADVQQYDHLYTQDWKTIYEHIMSWGE